MTNQATILNKKVPYGNKRNYAKIDICISTINGWHYVCSTTWSKSCKEAKQAYLSTHSHLLASDVKANFSKKA